MLRKTNSIGWIVWGLGSLYFLAEYFIRVSTGVLGPTLLEDFNTDAYSIGLLSSCFYYSYIGMQIPVGLLVDRLGVRKLLSASAIMFGVACILFASMQTLQLGYVSRFIMGFVGAFAFVSTLKLITVYFPYNKFSLLAGITQGCGFVGAVIGAAPMAYLFTWIGWRLSYVYFGVIFIIIGGLMLIFIRDHVNEKRETSGTATSLWSDLKIVLSSRQTWLNGLFIGLIYAPTEIFGEQWGPMFLNIAGNNIGIEKSALQTSFIFIGMAIGCPLIGYVADRIGTIKTMRFCSIVCLILMSCIIYGRLIYSSLDHVSLCMLAFTYGIFASAIIPSYTLATKVNPLRTAGIALGVTNMATVIIGAILIPTIGKLLDIVSTINPTVHIGQSIHNYTVSNFYLVFSILPICFICCFLLTFALREPQAHNAN
jgi:MFS family permease